MDRRPARATKSQKQKRYTFLRSKWFTPLEARELSAIPRNTPGLRSAVYERQERRSAFEKIAAWKIAVGKWKRTEVEKKWANNLSRMYTKRDWRVKYGPTPTATSKLPKDSPNPWELYRDAERRTGGRGGRGYVSPWEIKRVVKGKIKLERELLKIQKAEKDAKRSGMLNKQIVESWVEQKKLAVGQAKGKHKEQLKIELHRLERLI